MTKVLLAYVNSFMDNLIPIGVSLLSACLKKAGHETRLFDTTFYRTRDVTGDEARIASLQIKSANLEEFGIKEKSADLISDFRKTIEDFKPRLIGFSDVESTYPITLKMLDGIRDYDVLKLAGGIRVTMSPEYAISEKNLDMICVGEGEGAIVDLADRLEKNQDYSDVLNLWVKKDGKITRNPLRPLANLDDLPDQDWSIYEKERFFKPMGGKVWISGPIELARGCQKRCGFCCNAKLQDTYGIKDHYPRERSVRNFIDELKRKKAEFGLQYLYLVAENFLQTSGERFREFVDLYKDIRLPFWIETRPETVNLEKVMELMKIGCEGLSIGVEHGNEKFRRETLNRFVPNSEIIRAFDTTRGSGIRVCANNIIGFPTETRELVFDTIELNRRLQPTNIIVNIFCAYRGTKLWDLAVEKGYISRDTIAGDYRSDAGLNMPQLSNLEIMGLQRTFPLYVRFPKEYWPEIKTAEGFDKKGEEAFAKLSDVYRKKYL